jgi:L-serine deaminase
LIPRDALASTEITAFTQDGKIVERLIPALKELELDGIPHAASIVGTEQPGIPFVGIASGMGGLGIGLAGLGIRWMECKTKR